MKRTLPALFVLAAVVFMTSCSKKGPSYTKYIPKESSYVIALDVKSMVMKLEKDSLSVENMLQVIRDTADPSKYAKALEIWNQFKDAGLDLESKIFVSVPSLDMAAGSLNVQVLAGLKDEKKLEAFIAKMPGSPKVVKEGNISYATHEEMVVGWNDEAVMILGGHTTPRFDMPQMGEDSSVSAPAPVPGAGLGLVEKLKKYFALKKEESIVTLDEFNRLAGDKADVAIFTNSSSLATSSANPALAMMPKVKDLMQGIYSTTAINFEDGKVVMKSSTFIGPKLAEILKKYTGPTVDMSMVEAYPAGNIDGVVAFSFNPELIPALLKETGFDALVDLGLSQQGITSAEIVKAFKGDFAIVFSDFSISQVHKVSEEGYSYSTNEPSGKLVFALRLNDKASFDKIVALGTKTGMLVKQGNRLLPAKNGVPDSAEHYYLGVENDLLVMSNDETIYKNYVAKTGKNDLSSDAKAALKGSSIGFYVDAAKILNGIPETLFDSNMVHEKNIFNRSKTVFRTLNFTTSNFDGKKIDGHGEVTMANDRNSLSQLVRFLMYTAEEMKLHDAENEARWHHADEPSAADSTAGAE